MDKQTPYFRDIAAALVLIAVGLAGAAEAMTFPARAAAWPLAMWGALIAFSAVLLLTALRGLIRARGRS